MLGGGEGKRTENLYASIPTSAEVLVQSLVIACVLSVLVPWVGGRPALLLLRAVPLVHHSILPHSFDTL